MITLARQQAFRLEKSFSNVNPPIFRVQGLRVHGRFGRASLLAEDTGTASEQLLLPLRDLVGMNVAKRLRSSASVCSPRNAAKATFDLNAGEWFRRVRRVMRLLWNGDIIASASRRSTCRAVPWAGPWATPSGCRGLVGPAHAQQGLSIVMYLKLAARYP
jgi:hypothetical protein